MVLGQLTSLQTIVSRNISAFDSAVVTIGEVSSGNTWNVIADQAYVKVQCAHLSQRFKII